MTNPAHIYKPRCNPAIQTPSNVTIGTPVSSLLSDAHKSALDYYDRFGWCVLPAELYNPAGAILTPAEYANNVKHSKKTAVKWPKERPSLREMIKLLLAFPEHAIGALTGPRSNNLIVIDLDGAWERRCFDAFNLEFDACYSFDNLVTANTGPNHWHVFYVYEDSANISSVAHIKLPGFTAEHIDVRGEGGFIMLPPSVCQCGKVYKWINSPFASPIPSLPTYLASVLPKRNRKDEEAEEVTLTESHTLYKVSVTYGATKRAQYEDLMSRGIPKGETNEYFKKHALVIAGMCKADWEAGLLKGKWEDEWKKRMYAWYAIPVPGVDSKARKAELTSKLKTTEKNITDGIIHPAVFYTKNKEVYQENLAINTAVTAELAKILNGIRADCIKRVIAVAEELVRAMRANSSNVIMSLEQLLTYCKRDYPVLFEKADKKTVSRMLGYIVQGYQDEETDARALFYFVYRGKVGGYGKASIYDITDEYRYLLGIEGEVRLGEPRKALTPDELALRKEIAEDYRY
jgi:hypothetical protein